MTKRLTSRRSFWRGAAGVSAATIWGGDTLDAMMQHTNTASRPSELKINKGFITVPDKPGLGVTLNDDVMKQHLLEPGYFEPTPQWDKETGRVNDRLFS
jgi:hypothetical protein